MQSGVLSTHVQHVSNNMDLNVLIIQAQKDPYSNIVKKQIQKIIKHININHKFITINGSDHSYYNIVLAP